jgi:hypothetical protein
VKGVGKVQIAGASVIDAGKHEGDVLIRSNASSSPAGRPFLLAFEFGKGRVVAMGDASWLSPEWLVKADNAQLMLNVFNWLARKDCDSIREDEIAKFVETKTGNDERACHAFEGKDGRRVEPARKQAFLRQYESRLRLLELA